LATVSHAKRAVGLSARDDDDSNVKKYTVFGHEKPQTTTGQIWHPIIHEIFKTETLFRRVKNTTGCLRLKTDDIIKNTSRRILTLSLFNVSVSARWKLLPLHHRMTLRPQDNFQPVS
jgi:hypothetical protein